MKFYYILFFLFASLYGHAQPNSKPVFKVIPLGIKGGIDESNLSSYMLAVEGTDDYVCLDAGTLHSGIRKAILLGTLKGDATTILRKDIKGYLISHAHLDHVAGLIINSPDDSSKNIYGLPYCLDILKEKYFSWKSWANFADEGEAPLLKKYHYVNLSPDTETVITNTVMNVKAFSLSHSNPYQSSAFLIRHADNYILYLGDTGADEMEKSGKLHLLWQQVAQIIKDKKMAAIFIEVSYPDEQPVNKLFGHLRPDLLMKEMNDLSLLTGMDALKNLPVVITHMKPSGKNEMIIKEQLVKENSLHLKLIFPQQGKLMEF